MTLKNKPRTNLVSALDGSGPKGKPRTNPALWLTKEESPSVEFQTSISDILDQVPAEAAARIGRKPDSGDGKEGTNEANRSHFYQGAHYK